MVAGFLKVCGREKSSMLRETGLCGRVKELKTLERRGTLGSDSQCHFLLGA